MRARSRTVAPPRRRASAVRVATPDSGKEWRVTDAPTLVREAIEVDRLSAALANQFEDVSRDLIEEDVREEFDRWSDVPVRDFVPIFVERALRGKLRRRL
jgi:hypothetical protein